ncbi:MAG: M28 family peptidase [Candidatus Lokiarchaeota archaeon]|nr:M28 family peptidase [Candidatus Lokiarchaeota archaeon]
MESYKNSNFKKETLSEYVTKFSFPRLAGSEGEKKAVKLTIDTFKEIGFNDSQIIRRDFEFSDFYSTTLIILLMSLNLIFNLILVLFAYIQPLLSLIFTIFMVVVVLLIIKGLKHPEKPGFWGEYFGETLSATNIFTKIPAKLLPEKVAGNIIISAHLDSKSQTYKTFWRIVFYKVWIFGGISLGFFYGLFLFMIFANMPFDYRITISGVWTTIILVSMTNIFLMFLSTHNKSPGALDNASGMAIVFELSTHFLNHPLDNFNLWFCQFSAEELGTMGSRIFVNDHENVFEKGRVFTINNDMVSCFCHKKNRIEYFKSYGAIIRKLNAPLLSKYLEIAAREEKLQIKGFHLSTGAHTDTVPFHLRGWDAIDITTKAAARYTHTIHDTPDKVDPQILKETCQIINKALNLIDQDYEKLCNNNELNCDV